MHTFRLQALWQNTQWKPTVEVILKHQVKNSNTILKMRSMAQRPQLMVTSALTEHTVQQHDVYSIHL